MEWLSWRRRQVGAIPYRRGADGAIEVLLVTTRGSGRWVIPKGWPMWWRAPHDAAAREAFEEGGVTGRAEPGAIGRYPYEKRVGGARVPCRVDVFMLAVDRELDAWPEASERRRRWFAPEEAARRVREPELQAILRGLAERR